MTGYVIRHINMLARLPSPIAGLALAIVSLGWAWELVFPEMNGVGRFSGAILSCLLIAPLTLKFVFHSSILIQELKHPVIGSVLPTYCMSLMLISRSIEQYQHWLGVVLWLLAIALHLLFLCLFIIHRCRDFKVEQLIPSWFIPPIGIIVAAVSFPGEYESLAIFLLNFGMISYLILLPIILLRLIIFDTVPEPTRPTIAILAAPASLSLVGYLTLVSVPSLVMVSLLLSTALLMTLLVYVALFHFIRLTFSPSFSSLTFPLVISATAVLKTANWLTSIDFDQETIITLLVIGKAELVIATAVVMIILGQYIKKSLFL